jgi:hypothetical protein
MELISKGYELMSSEGRKILSEEHYHVVLCAM